MHRHGVARSTRLDERQYVIEGLQWHVSQGGEYTPGSPTALEHVHIGIWMGSVDRTKERIIQRQVAAVVGFSWQPTIRTRGGDSSFFLFLFLFDAHGFAFLISMARVDPIAAAGSIRTYKTRDEPPRSLYGSAYHWTMG